MVGLCWAVAGEQCGAMGQAGQAEGVVESPSVGLDLGVREQIQGLVPVSAEGLGLGGKMRLFSDQMGCPVSAAKCWTSCMAARAPAQSPSSWRMCTCMPRTCGRSPSSARSRSSTSARSRRSVARGESPMAWAAMP